jgi:hypothetical protein
MAWYYRLLFAAAAAWCIYAVFLGKEFYYPFSRGRPEMRAPAWLGRAVNSLLAIFFIWLALLK